MIGVLLVIAVMAIFRFMSGMEQSGTIQMANAVGVQGECLPENSGRQAGRREGADFYPRRNPGIRRDHLGRRIGNGCPDPSGGSRE